MNDSGHGPQEFPRPTPPKSFSFFNPQNLIIIYTSFRILDTMRRQLGLEAMLEYIDKYLALIDKDNPPLQAAVSQALKLMKVERLYRDTVRTND